MSLFSRIFGRGIAEDKTLPALPTVQFDTGWITEDVKIDLKSTIENMDVLPSHLKLQVFDAALNMVRRGGDLGGFCRATEALNIDGLSKGETAAIARFLWFRCKSMVDAHRMLDAGITKASWLYSGAPCDGSPNQNSLHNAANGRHFGVASGLMISGTPSWPGRDRGCKCVMKPVIKGFS